MRLGGRKNGELREISIARGYTKYAEGSVLIEFGDTKVLCNASVEDSVPRFLKGKGQGWVTAEYGMIPRSTDSRMEREATRSQRAARSIEIQRLIGRSLRAVVDLKKLGERTIKIDCDVWSVTSFNELRKDGMEVERFNLLNPNEKPKKTYVENCLKDAEGPILAASDYMRITSDQIRPFTNKSFYSLGTDGYGRSDSREKLRNFFEVDKKYIVTYALSVLAKEQLIPSKYAEQAIKKYNIDKNKPIPTKL